MSDYSFLQIVLFFFVYCFLGWIWETFYVSIKEKKFVNRGFMHGPLIPIYGFAAMTVLFVTLPVKDNLFLVFVCGTVGATVLELVTGTVMEVIFHVRYWNYSYLPLNYKGYVSLPSSVVWGLFSILLIQFIHRPVEHMVLGLKVTATEVVTVVLVMFASADFAVSFREAMDLKEILKHIAELEKVRKVQERVDAITAKLENDKENIKEKINERMSALGKAEFRRISGLLERNPSAVSAKYARFFDTVKTSIKELKNNGKELKNNGKKGAM